MKRRKPIRTPQGEAGIALLISIFILLLISVVAIALIVSSGTESALAGNYRSSTAVYYAALSGLEEARSRLLAKNPSSFKNTAPVGFVPAPGNTMAIGNVSYVLNPSPDPTFGENVGNILTLYPDTEYDVEFGAGALAAANTANTVKTTPSVWNTGPLNAVNGTMAGPLYKWVRINPVSEVSLKLNVSPFTDPNDAFTPIFYDGAQLNVSNSGRQVFEVTSLAVLPNGSQKLLQYLVTPSFTMPPFPAALTLAGSVASNVVSYTAPSSNPGFFVKGLDQDCNGATTGVTLPAIGVFNNADIPAVTSGINPPSVRNSNYPGTNASPDMEVVYGSFTPAMTTPSGLDAVVQAIIANADATVPTNSGSAAERSFLSSLLSSSAMGPTSPLTVVVDGDLDLTGWTHTGYGLLLVTGNFNYDPKASWKGIVMVVGQGTVTGSNSPGSGEFDGAMLVARTRDPSGNLLSGSYLGNSSVNFNAGSSMDGIGIRYSNCWIQKAMPNAGFKILSFREIAQ